MKQVLPKLEKLFWSLKQLYSGIIMLYSCTSKVQQMNDRGHLPLFYNLALLSCDAHGTCGRFWGFLLFWPNMTCPDKNGLALILSHFGATGTVRKDTKRSWIWYEVVVR